MADGVVRGFACKLLQQSASIQNNTAAGEGTNDKYRVKRRQRKHKTKGVN